jgi:beta-lactam-binding protein with PASTA domain/tRNA A-37 threonylcarbamoyl transferase component Bud32
MTTPRLLSDRYELGDTLGYGGMSEVHRGLDKRLGRDVAVKVLRADLARDPQFQMRFRREAQNAAALNHPAIVAVYDTGEVESDFGPLPYIVMEYVDGQTLREIVKTQGPMSQQRVIEVMADVCAALDFSHKHNIIHRDVKPANIMINRAGAVKVMDFGIARALGEGQNMTQTAAVIGTAQYLSPEQARGEAVDARSDVYAAGCVLFELLTGEPPFTGDTPVAVAYQHVREDPRSPSEVNPSVTPQLDAIVLKALSKNPVNRYQSAAEMRADLVRVRSGQQPLAPVVMSEDERTALLNPGSTGQTRRINGAGTRHAPAPVPPVRYDDRGGYDDYDGDPDRGRRRRIAIGVASAVVLALLGLTAYLIYGGSPAAKQVSVPDVSGQQPEAARAALQAANLLVTIDRVPSDVDQKDRVVGTDPTANTQVPERSTVKLQVGNGPDQAAVPPLTGRTVADAGPLLTQRGLVLGAQTEQNTNDPAQIGKIVSSTPAAGENVPAGTAVAVVVGKQQATVAVPNVVGRDADDAERALRQAGFQVRRATVDAGGNEGDVTGTDPAAGAQVAQGSTVTLQVTSGDGSEPEMPDVTGDKLRDAQRKLQQEGINDVSLQPGTTSDEDDNGRVLDQSPSAGTKVAPGDRVVLIVGQVSGSGGSGGGSGGSGGSSGSSSPSSGPGGGN